MPAASEVSGAPEAARQSPQGGAANDLSDWHGLVRRLGLKGMTAQLADNCVLDGWDGKALSLKVDPACRGLIGSLAERRLQEAISEAVGHTVSLQLQVQEAEEETPAQREAREKRERHEATAADIAGDPLVLALQDTFDAEIVADSIRRIE